MMYLSSLWLGFAGVIFLQLWLCFRAKRKLLKLLPAGVLALAFAVCILVFRIASGMGDAGRGAAFAADWHSVLFCFWALGDVLAWGIFLLIKLAQKVRKLFVM